MRILIKHKTDAHAPAYYTNHYTHDGKVYALQNIYGTQIKSLADAEEIVELLKPEYMEYKIKIVPY